MLRSGGRPRYTSRVPTPSPALRRSAWALLLLALGTVVWGAYVRASGSGAGCGDHWPSCNGFAIPPSPTWNTRVEYVHRLTSGLISVGSLLLFVWARRLPPGHPGRRSTLWVLLLTLSEGALGALLVKLGLTGTNDSAARAVAVAAHLLNTFLLVGAMAVTTDALGVLPRVATTVPRPRAAFGLLSLLLLSVGISGAIAALGDTLFPAASLSAGWAQDLSPTAHFLLRLRGVHPLLAVTTALLAVLHAFRAAREPALQRPALAVLGAMSLQLMVGLANWLLLAPVLLQLLHLLMADVLWIAWVKLAYRRRLLMGSEPA